ncbi:hypothetical protein DL96DRAFT_1813698, partial [Flagelloscypha sp. PMI_526]
MTSPLPQIKQALQSNSSRQLELVQSNAHLSSELAALDKLLDEADLDTGEHDLGAVRTLEVAGSSRPASLIPPSGFLQAGSPFMEESSKRNRYLSFTSSRPYTNKEKQALARAVAQEKQREDYMTTHGLLRGDEPSINWTVVSEKVTDSSPVGQFRRSGDCRVAWLSAQEPTVNHGKWNEGEKKQLSALQAKYISEHPDQPVDWQFIAAELGTKRPPVDCMRQLTKDESFRFTDAWDTKLLKAIKVYGTNNWYPGNRYVHPSLAPEQSKRHYVRYLDPDLLPTGSEWSKAELERLKVLTEIFGHAYAEMLPYFPGRTSEEIRNLCKSDDFMVLDRAVSIDADEEERSGGDVPPPSKKPKRKVSSKAKGKTNLSKAKRSIASDSDGHMAVASLQLEAGTGQPSTSKPRPRPLPKRKRQISRSPSPEVTPDASGPGESTGSVSSEMTGVEESTKRVDQEPELETRTRSGRTIRQTVRYNSQAEGKELT